MEDISTHINYIEKGISIIVPVFNSEKSIKELNKRIITVLNNEDLDYEIIYINDASEDSSYKIIKSISIDNENIKGIDLNKNFGQHNALLCGIRNAKYDIVITLDDDLQNPPEEIPKLLKKIDEGYDVVYGYPKEEKHSYLRNWASIFTKFALKTAMGVANVRHVSSYRAFKKKLAESFESYKGSFVSIDVLLSWGTNSFTSIPVDHEERTGSKSNYTFKKLFNHALNMITGFSVLPLQIASMMGLLLSLFGLGVLIYVLGRFMLQGSPVPGFPFIASIISIFSGAQLLALGIIGEYLARMHFRVMNKPQYLVKK
tara:strand:- start:831 stop:1775 length:945 start_codon:yes stop_codon:yes gene_type:complete